MRVPPGWDGALSRWSAPGPVGSGGLYCRPNICCPALGEDSTSPAGWDQTWPRDLLRLMKWARCGVRVARGCRRVPPSPLSTRRPAGSRQRLLLPTTGGAAQPQPTGVGRSQCAGGISPWSCLLLGLKLTAMTVTASFKIPTHRFRFPGTTQGPGGIVRVSWMLGHMSGGDGHSSVGTALNACRVLALYRLVEGLEAESLSSAGLPSPLLSSVLGVL